MRSASHFFRDFASRKKRPFLISEIGTNHGGSFKQAKKMLIESAEAGADAVKFQLFNPDELVREDAKVFDSKNRKSQRELYRRLTLTHDQYRRLFQLARKLGIAFFASCWDERHADFLNDLGAPFFKIGSGDLTHFPLLRYIAAKRKPIILSTGLSTSDEIRKAIQVIRREGNPGIALLYCVSNYPAGLEDINLNSILYLSEEFKLPVGYSDHTIGIAAAIAAATKGAALIEKHYTLNKQETSDFGINNDISMDYADLKALSHFCSNLGTLLGKTEKRVGPSELRNRSLVRRGIYAKEEIRRGERIALDHLIFLRPEAGISAQDYRDVVNSTAVRPLRRGEAISWDAVRKA